MSEQWNGIYLAEIRVSRLKTMANRLRSVFGLNDSSQSIDYEFETATQGAVIVTNNYMSWEFIAPKNWALSPGNTVADLFDSIDSAATRNRVPRWEEFAAFMNRNKSAINFFVSEGARATIIDAHGNRFPGTTHQINAFGSFHDCIVWLRSWMGSEILAAPSSIVYAHSNLIRFSLTVSENTISCSFLL